MSRIRGNAGRRSIRLPGRDYSRENAYFVTLSTAGKFCVLGDLQEGVWVPSDNGRIAGEEWTALGERFAAVYLDAWVVMPNHLHGIVWLRDVAPGGTSMTAQPATGIPAHASRPSGTVNARKPLGQIVGAFKTAVMRRINHRDGTPGQTIWQRNYYERVVRNPEELERVRPYIRDNPRNWMRDAEHPAAAPFDLPLTPDG